MLPLDALVFGAVALGVVIPGGLSGCASRDDVCNTNRTGMSGPVRDDVVVLGESAGALADAFNRTSDRWRVVALVSPTCSECLLGAQAVEKEITRRYGADQAAALIVWVSVLASDDETSSRISANIFPAMRAKQFYDVHQVVGLDYARHAFRGYEARALASLPPGHRLADTLASRRDEVRTQWDLYMLYKPGVRWTQAAAPVPTHWIRHVGRGPDGRTSTYWRDLVESGPREGDLFEAVRQMADDALGQADSSSNARLRIELLGRRDCPQTPLLRERMDRVISLVDPTLGVEYVDQDALDPGDVRRNWPAPTVLVNGADLLGMVRESCGGMSCRLYSGSLPSESELSAALRQFRDQ